MPARISVRVGSCLLNATLSDSRVAQKIAGCLPVEAKARTWGEEVYFPVPVRTAIDAPVTRVSKGDIGYWPDGACVCIFFGPTPMSRGDEIVPASAVEIIGRVEGDLSGLKAVRDGEKVEMSLRE